MKCPFFSFLQVSADALIAQKRAEIAAKMAAINASRSSPIVNTATSSSSSLSASKPGTPGIPVVSDDLVRRVAEAKRKVAEFQNRAAVKDNPYLVSSYVSSRRRWPA